MQRCRQKCYKCPPKWVFPPFVTPKFFCQKSVSVGFVALWCPNFMQKLEKTNKRPLKYSKTDHRPRTDRDDYIGHPRINQGYKNHIFSHQILSSEKTLLSLISKLKLKMDSFQSHSFSGCVYLDLLQQNTDTGIIIWMICNCFKVLKLKT